MFDSEGNRHTAADLLQRADPARLTVLLHATAEAIVWKDRASDERPVASGVAYKDAKGKRKWAYLKDGRGGEVIVAAGAIGSPQMLMLSGVGQREGLERLGIKVVVEQPMVGQGMADNPMNWILVPSPAPVELSLVQVVGVTRFGSYIEGISGPSAQILNGVNREGSPMQLENSSVTFSLQVIQHLSLVYVNHLMNLNPINTEKRNHLREDHRTNLHGSSGTQKLQPRRQPLCYLQLF